MLEKLQVRGSFYRRDTLRYRTKRNNVQPNRLALRHTIL